MKEFHTAGADKWKLGIP